ncbi:hypothetical protein M404DRAFT_26515 [Pisolithus tinctorius Marx 270]|uniref:Uncharacterized protein n=1 Tax=Pisolithus tinctorius Marx 270 TaxID=870435 RepID=A0A0C3NTZ2_PISTI|nr:hypothetical protein M404DRAFT_26515 [Pisolithus tinctorius Marx 270]
MVYFTPHMNPSSGNNTWSTLASLQEWKGNHCLTKLDILAEIVTHHLAPDNSPPLNILDDGKTLEVGQSMVVDEPVSKEPNCIIIFLAFPSSNVVIINVLKLHSIKALELHGKLGLEKHKSVLNEFCWSTQEAGAHVLILSMVGALFTGGPDNNTSTKGEDLSPELDNPEGSMDMDPKEPAPRNKRGMKKNWDKAPVTPMKKGTKWVIDHSPPSASQQPGPLKKSKGGAHPQKNLFNKSTVNPKANSPKGKAWCGALPRDLQLDPEQLDTLAALNLQNPSTDMDPTDGSSPLSSPPATLQVKITPGVLAQQPLTKQQVDHEDLDIPVAGPSCDGASATKLGYEPL